MCVCVFEGKVSCDAVWGVFQHITPYEWQVVLVVYVSADKYCHPLRAAWLEAGSRLAV